MDFFLLPACDCGDVVKCMVETQKRVAKPNGKGKVANPDYGRVLFVCAERECGYKTWMDECSTLFPLVEKQFVTQSDEPPRLTAKGLSRIVDDVHMQKSSAVDNLKTAIQNLKIEIEKHKEQAKEWRQRALDTEKTLTDTITKLQRRWDNYRKKTEKETFELWTMNNDLSQRVRRGDVLEEENYRLRHQLHLAKSAKIQKIEVKVVQPIPFLPRLESFLGAMLQQIREEPLECIVCRENVNVYLQDHTHPSSVSICHHCIGVFCRSCISHHANSSCPKCRGSIKKITCNKTAPAKEWTHQDLITTAFD